MTGAVDLMESERGVVCILVLIAVTVLAVLKVITGEQWLTYTQVIVMGLVASKTVTGAIETVTAKKTPAPPAPASE